MAEVGEEGIVGGGGGGGGADEGAMESSLRSLLPTLPSAVITELVSLGVCTRCVLRFLNVRSVNFAGNIPSPSLLVSQLEAGVTEGDSCVPSADCSQEGDAKEPCVVCCGVLHTLVGEEAQKQIEEASRKDGYVFVSFCLEVSVPAIALVRERALWYHLKRKFPEEAKFKSEFETNNIVSLKEAIKWSLITPLEARLAAKFDASALFRIALLYNHSSSLEELQFVSHTGGDAKRRRHDRHDRHGRHDGHESAPAAPVGLAAVAAVRTAEAGDSVATVVRSLAAMNLSTFLRHFSCPPAKLSTPCGWNVMCWRMPVFVGGRYLKFSRNISQSRWMIDDERMGEGSVQEVIGNVVFPHYKGDSYKFHAAGREDIDVRMLGPGRPFIIEIANARNIPCPSEMIKLETEINSLKEGWVRVRELRQVGIEACAIMREGESEKQKEYAAVVWLSRPVTQADFEALSSLKELELQQKTPIRVLHRRSPLTRPRSIHWMRCEEIKGSPNYFLLFLCTQAGTYIKEFVHGDLGRTFPNVGSLLNCEADILQLDVMDVKMDFL